MLFASCGRRLPVFPRGFMRITGGKLGGRRLVAPDTVQVRPTSDRTRQAIFNILQHNDFGTGFSLDGAAGEGFFARTRPLGGRGPAGGGRRGRFGGGSGASRAPPSGNGWT